MAEIYLASPGDGSGPQRVAIKVIHPQNATDPDFVRMLMDEAKLAVQLNHPNIVCTYDLGKEHDEYYIVMEFIDGADLFKVQQRAAIKRLSFPLALSVFVTREVTRALDFAHRLKDEAGRALYIVHRDISPQNVLVSYEGEVKITDFGIAKAAHRAEQTQAGIIKGKYYYMSPEQAMGRLIDARTDIFAAGILLYEMLIGEMLYYHDDLDKLLAMVRRADIPPPSKRRRDVPPALEAIVMKALRKKPEERYQTAEEYGAALDGFLREFAPDYTADDLGVFVLRVMDAPRSRGRRMSGDLTQQIRVEEDNDPTTGLTGEQLAKLGIHDENSLIFQPAERLQAILRGEVRNQGAPPARAEQSGSMSARKDDDSGLQTRRRLIDKKMVLDPGLLDEMTVPDPVRKPSAGESSNAVPTGDWSEDQEGQRTNPVWSDQRVTRRHFARRAPSVAIGSASDDVHELPTVSHDAVPPIRAIPVDSAADDEHDAPTAPRPAETAALARVSMEIPAIDVAAAKAAYAASSSEHSAVSRDGSRSLVFELMPQPAPSEAHVELVISDDGFARPSEPPGRFELTQSDDYGALPGQTISPPPPVDQRRIDPISLEATQNQGNLPEPRRSTRSQASTGSMRAARRPSSRGRLVYVLAGLGAALVSAILTWQLTIGPRLQHPPTETAVEDAGPPVGPTLLVYDVPDVEPAPAPLLNTGATTPGPEEPANPTSPTGPATATTTAPSAPATKDPNKSGQEEARSDVGTIELNSTPEGAEVFIKRKPVGTTPLVLRDLPLDKDVKVELRLEGFKKKRKRIKWKGETRVTVNVKMRTDSSDDDGDDGASSETPGKDKDAREPAKDKGPAAPAAPAPTED